MKTRPFTALQNSLGLTRRSALSVAALIIFSSHSAHAVDYYWDADGDTTLGTGGTGSWTKTTALWRNGSAVGPLENWVNANAAVLGGTAGTLTTNEAIVATKVSVDNTSTGTFTVVNGVGGTFSISAGVLDVASGKALTFNSVVAGTGLTTVQGGGTVTFLAVNRAYGGNLLSTGAGTNLVFSGTNGLDSGTATIGLTARDGGTIQVNGTNNYRAGLVLGGAGFGGGTLKLGNAGSLVRQNTLSVTVSGTSQSTILSTLANTGTTFGGFNLGGTALGANFTVAATGDPSGVDLEFSAGAKNGILTKAGAGVLRLNAGFILNNANDYTTFNSAANAVNITAGTFLNEGTIKSITAISGGILQTGATGIFDQVNLNGGTFEVSRASGLFTTGLTYAVGKNAINFNGGTLKYVGVNTDYSSQFTFGASGGTVDTNTQNVTFATALTDSGPFTKAGAGILTLTAPNALSGAIAVTGGTLDLGGFPTSVGSLASGTTAGDLNLGSSVLTTGSGNNSTVYAGNISGVGAILVKNGTGIQSLSGTNTYTGGNNVNAGVLVFRTTAAKPASGLVSVAAGASLGLGVGGAGFFSSANVDSLYANTLANVSMDPAAGVGIDTSAGDFTYATSQSTRFLYKLGANVLTLSGTNTYSGTTNIMGGTLKYAKPASLYNSDVAQWTPVNLPVNSGATLAVTIGGANDFSDTQVDTLITQLSAVNSNGLKAGSNFGFDTTNAAGNVTYSHVLANSTGTGGGAVGYSKLGAGTLILDQANTYTGTTTVAAGALTLSGARTAASGVYSVGNLAGNTGTLNILTGTYALAANSFFVGTGDTAVGVVNQTGGDVSFTGGNRLLIGNGGNSTGTYNLSGGTLSSTGTGAFIRLGVNTGTGNPTSIFNLSGTGTLNSGTASVQIGRSDSANVSNTINFFNQSGTLSTATIATLTMGGGASVAATAANIQATLDLSAGTFTATTFGSLSAGDANTSTIIIRGTAMVNLPKFGNNTALGAGSTAVVKFNGGTLLPTAASTNYLSVVSSALVQAGGAKFDVATGMDIAITQALQQDPASTGGGLTKLGVGTLTLTGANTYTGSTTVSGGILSLASPSLADASSVTIAIGATLDLTHSQTDIVNSLTLGGTTYTSGTFSSSTPAAAGFITGTGSIQVNSGAPSGFATYINGFGSIPANMKGPSDDPDSDGINNLLEYALNGNASVSNTSILPKLVVTATDFEFTYSRLDLSLSDTVQSFQYGSTLTGWTSILIPAGPGVSSVGIATVTITDIGTTDTVKVSIPKSAAVGGKLFGRLQVIK